LLRHFAVPENLTSIINEGLTCRVVHGNQLIDNFLVKTGVRQGCLLSPFLFLLAIDWAMKTATAQRRIQWTLWTQSYDLGFADNLALFSHNQQIMQEKTTTVAENSRKIHLKIHWVKSKVLNVNAASTTAIKFKGA
jgi:hypothetical protein